MDGVRSRVKVRVRVRVTVRGRLRVRVRVRRSDLVTRRVVRQASDPLRGYDGQGLAVDPKCVVVGKSGDIGGRSIRPTDRVWASLLVRATTSTLV